MRQKIKEKHAKEREKILLKLKKKARKKRSSSQTLNDAKRQTSQAKQRKITRVSKQSG